MRIRLMSLDLQKEIAFDERFKIVKLLIVDIALSIKS